MDAEAVAHAGVEGVRAGLAAARAPPGLGGERVAVVIAIHVVADADLMLVAGALGLLALFPGAREHRDEQGRQDCDDGNDHQQLDEREARPHGRARRTA